MTQRYWAVVRGRRIFAGTIRRSEAEAVAAFVVPGTPGADVRRDAIWRLIVAEVTAAAAPKEAGEAGDPCGASAVESAHAEAEGYERRELCEARDESPPASARGDKLERLGRVLYEAMAGAESTLPWDQLKSWSRERYCRGAEAVVAAIRRVPRKQPFIHH